MLTDQEIYAAKILIVDDEPDIVYLLEFTLRKEGYQNIRTTTDSREVKETYQDFQPDLVLLDIRMPHIDGFQVIEQLRDIEKNYYVPVLVMTAQGDRENRLRAFELGARDFIAKPFDFSEVVARIYNLVVVRLLYNQLNLNSQRLEAVLDSTGDAIAMFDDAQRLVFANKQFATLFQLTERDLLSKSAETLRRELKSLFQEPDVFEESDAALFDDVSQSVEGIVEIREPDRKLLYRYSTPVRDLLNHIAGRIVVYRDVSKDAEIEQMTAEVVRLRAELQSEYDFEHIIGNSPAMREMYTLMRRSLDSDISVLIHGESGTGKELVAKAIHFNSPRKKGPFVPVNCAAIPESLIESELFGHEKGSFTGATTRRIGRFEQADGGTIFLDEIGEMDLLLQAKLLRVLQEREIQRVGGTATIPVNVRVIAATNKELEETVRGGKFREDLFYRIAAFPVRVPPLRERREDVPMLAEHFLKKYGEQMGKEIKSATPGAIHRLMEHEWPGNVREFENVIQRSILLESSNMLEAGSLPPQMGGSRRLTAAMSPSAMPESEDILPLEELERRAIIHALQKTDNNVTQSASALGINRATLYRKMKRYQIDAP